MLFKVQLHFLRQHIHPENTTESCIGDTARHRPSKINIGRALCCVRVVVLCAGGRARWIETGRVR